MGDAGVKSSTETMGSGQSRFADARRQAMAQDPVRQENAAPAAEVAQDAVRRESIASGFSYNANGEVSYQLAEQRASVPSPPPSVAEVQSDVIAAVPVSSAPIADLQAIVPAGYVLMQESEMDETLKTMATCLARNLAPVVRKICQLEHLQGKYNMFADFAMDDEICPLSKQLIKDTVLPFAPTLDANSCSEISGLKALELSCGHRFSAIYATFHFMRTGSVVCPVCKQGDARMYLREDDVPDHWFGPMATQVIKEKMQRRYNAHPELYGSEL